MKYIFLYLSPTNGVSFAYGHMEQQTGFKQEKEDIKDVYCHPAYLTSMQSTSWKTLGW